MGKPYIDREELHSEMKKCKQIGKLTDRANQLFEIMAKEISGLYYFEDPEEKKDAEQQIRIDLWKYWKGFKDVNVCRLKLMRNFDMHDTIIIDVLHYGKISAIASDINDHSSGKFMVDPKNINRSIENFLLLIQRHSKAINYSLDSVKKVITLMDVYNGESKSVKSSVEAFCANEEDPLIKITAKSGKMFFAPPPNAFSYFTTVCRNAALKSIQTYHGKIKNSEKISTNSINSRNDHIYNI